ncbi:hypothetical protein T4B_9853 [Trichinella pseudospiralis]|uniref:Uncharacterized protein n=2 Tax=Trichinella pseudospiralis TaxID=6337 RepID=A0A0V1JU91_TRIPS|nr:hypothetical protein T4A_10670 [Trichinella pseudospiralis]KRY90611.1 hypothetical protein T4D_13225 [Trichinella pseudospiralis]KRZ29374.1 hypothetical protein T4B_9853 [Trichinella pseudospiralis]KRZ38516.1 hypothetical protein T4C_1752 [Trichinella pseudospiralis]
MNQSSQNYKTKRERKKKVVVSIGNQLCHRLASCCGPSEVNNSEEHLTKSATITLPVLQLPTTSRPSNAATHIASSRVNSEVRISVVLRMVSVSKLRTNATGQAVPGHATTSDSSCTPRSTLKQTDPAPVSNPDAAKSRSSSLGQHSRLDCHRSIQQHAFQSSAQKLPSNVPFPLSDVSVWPSNRRPIHVPTPRPTVAHVSESSPVSCARERIFPIDILKISPVQADPLVQHCVADDSTLEKKMKKNSIHLFLLSKNKTKYAHYLFVLAHH